MSSNHLTETSVEQNAEEEKPFFHLGKCAPDISDHRTCWSGSHS
jgi:hypothetical protein